MRIAIDVQSLQGESRFRGLGSYTLGFVEGILSENTEHEILLIANNKCLNELAKIREAFEKFSPKICVWSWPFDLVYAENSESPHYAAARVAYVEFVNSLDIDLYHAASFFEGYGDQSILCLDGIDPNIIVSATQYDLIPLLYKDRYLKPNPTYQKFYLEKLQELNRCNLQLTISNHTLNQVKELMGFPAEIAYIGTATSEQFRILAKEEMDRIRSTISLPLNDNVILYTGGADERKNLKRLIGAFNLLIESGIDSFQLVIAGKIPEIIKDQLLNHASKLGVNEQDILFIGYVTQEQLVYLYNYCKLTVFPSFEEGFGMPVLEAMLCGAPIVCSGVSSIPEVADYEDCYFSPYSEKDIFKKMRDVILDYDLCEAIVSHGQERAKHFKWSKVARRALHFWEKHYSNRAIQPNVSLTYSSLLLNNSAFLKQASMLDEHDRKALAIDISQTDQSIRVKQLMVDVSELCQRDAATGVQRVVKNYLKQLLVNPPEGYRVFPVYATMEETYKYAADFVRRIGFNIGIEKDEEINWQPGDVFFGLDMQGHVQVRHKDFLTNLYRSGVAVLFEVYDLLPIQYPHLFTDPNAQSVHQALMELYTGFSGIVCISEATADAYRNWIQEQDIDVNDNFFIESVHIGSNIGSEKISSSEVVLAAEHQTILAQLEEQTCFLCVSTIEPRKRQEQIFEAFELLWEEGADLRLVFVGKQGWKTESLIEKITSSPFYGEKLIWLPGIPDPFLDELYKVCTCLICASVDEGFGLSVVESALHDLPIIARDIKVFREIAGEHAFYFKGNQASDLRQAIVDWLQLYNEKSHPTSTHMPIMNWHESTNELKSVLRKRLQPIPRLFVDVSELINQDAGTGIQRVVKKVLQNWLNHNDGQVAIRPVWATIDGGYRFADSFTKDVFGYNTGGSNEIVDFRQGDVFFGLDLQPQVTVARSADYSYMRRCGVKVSFLVYDILCLQLPQFFPKGSAQGFEDWLKVICRADHVICISETVQHQLQSWIQSNIVNTDVKTNWAHMGADFRDISERPLVNSETELLRNIQANPSFLMVGTIEPRKGHVDVFESFEILWQRGFEVNLVLVGKNGWLMDEFVQRISNHPETNRRLFWLQGVDDYMLSRVYKASTCLIAASYGEGFGLPLIEAAMNDIPIIARDLEVFKEVADDSAFYFSGEIPTEIADSIEEWLQLYKSGLHASSSNVNYISWQESADTMLKLVLEDVKSFKICA